MNVKWKLAVFWIHCLACLLFSFQALASTDLALPVSDIAKREVALEMNSHLLVYQDTVGKKTISTVKTLPTELISGNKEAFTSLIGSPNFGFSQSSWWVKFSLVNDQHLPSRVLLHQDYPLIDYIDFYQLNSDGSQETVSTGDRMPYAQRPIDYREFVFPILVPANSSSDVYLRFRSSGPINIGLTLHSDQSLFTKATNNQIAIGIYYGGFIVLALYNLFLFFSVKDRTFFYYLLYVVSYGAYFAVNNGLTYQYLWPSSPWLANQSLIMLLAMTLIFGLQFSRSILSIKTVSVWADQAALGFMLVAGISLLLSPFLAYKNLILPMAVLTIIVAFHLIVMGALAWRSGSIAARYYLLAWTALLLGVIAYMLKTFGVLPHNFFTQNAQQVGSLIEMILLSLAIGQKVNELQRHIYTDGLTKLSNRRYFDERFAREFVYARQHNRPLSLLVVDIDHFKKFNDQFGHKIGDEVLKTVAHNLAKSCRKTYFPCRYGGEEFAVIVPDTEIDNAEKLAQRIREAIELDNSLNHLITVSIGIACLKDDSYHSTVALFESADAALYSAKKNGRNRVELASRQEEGRVCAAMA